MKIVLLIISTVLFCSFISIEKQSSAIISDDSAKVCIVSGEVLKDDRVSFAYLDKTYEFCCSMCIKAFKKEPAKYISAEIFDPDCGMHDAKKELFFVHNKTKYYFCNENCKESFEASPEQYLGQFKKNDK